MGHRVGEFAGTGGRFFFRHILHISSAVPIRQKKILPIGRTPMFRRRYNRNMALLFVSIVFPFLSLAQVAVPKDPRNLTDAQRDFSQEYIHSNKGQRMMNEGCLLGANPELNENELKIFTESLQSGKLSEEQKAMKLKGDALCTGQTEGSAFGLSEPVMKKVSMMWTMVMGAGGGGGMSMRNLKQEASKARGALEAARESGADNVEGLQADADNAREEYDKHGENKRSDYCRYIPMGVESLAAFEQQTTNAHIVNHTGLHDSPQYASIMKMARHYDSRSGNAKVLSTGWGVTAGCYATMMATGGGLMELNPTKGWKNYLKLGASAFMAMYYGKMIGIHGNRADHMRKLAKSLPKRGDCNPITDRNCYCMEPASKGDRNYLHYCGNFGLGQKTAPNRQRSKIRRSCIDADTKVDPKCHCVARDNCLDDGFDVLFQGTTFPQGIDPSFMEDIKKLSKGTFQENHVASVEGGNKHATSALKVFEGLVKKVPKDRPLSSEEQRDVAVLKSFGLPKLMARALSLYRPSKAEQKAAENFLSSRMQNSHLPTRNPTNRNRAIKGRTRGQNLKNSNRKKSREDFSNPFAGLLKNKKKSFPKQAGKILTYAEISQNQAGVHTQDRHSLFEIISRRYKISAEERLR